MSPEPVLTADEIMAYLDEVFPQQTGRFRVLDMGSMWLTAEMETDTRDLRPGGTLSGPTMFTAADCTYYMVTLAMIGKQALTVTTSCTINFMRKPRPGNLRAEARILKLGKTLSVGDVLLYSPGAVEPVAHASLTYSIPPAR